MCIRAPTPTCSTYCLLRTSGDRPCLGVQRSGFWPVTSPLCDLRLDAAPPRASVCTAVHTVQFWVRQRRLGNPTLLRGPGCSAGLGREPCGQPPPPSYVSRPAPEAPWCTSLGWGLEVPGRRAPEQGRDPRGIWGSLPVLPGLLACSPRGCERSPARCRLSDAAARCGGARGWARLGCTLPARPARPRSPRPRWQSCPGSPSGLPLPRVPPPPQRPALSLIPAPLASARHGPLRQSGGALGRLRTIVLNEYMEETIT